MKGKKAIVTGGGSGYGKGIAASLVAAGAEVWITGRNRITEWGQTTFVGEISRCFALFLLNLFLRVLLAHAADPSVRRLRVRLHVG